MKRATLLKLLLLPVLVILGVGTKFYSGYGQEFIHNHLGGIIYVLFWILFAALLWPQVNPLKIVLWVLGITCCIEFSQLLQTAWLESLRENFMVRALIGSTFAMVDFFWYLLSALGGWGLLRIIDRQ